MIYQHIFNKLAHIWCLFHDTSVIHNFTIWYCTSFNNNKKKCLCILNYTVDGNIALFIPLHLYNVLNR